MNYETLDIPMILNGELIHPDQADEVRVLTYESGVRVRTPRPSHEHVAQVAGARQTIGRRLAALSTDEITCFLGAVSDEWLSGQSEGRRFAEKYGHRVTGYAPGMMTEDYMTIGHFMNQRFHTYDQIAAEFGNEWILDEWVPHQLCHIRAFPRGLVVQYLVGNLPLSSLYSLLRGVITRNLTLAKLPSRDPVSAYGLVRTMLEVDPGHPVSQSLSLFYWPQDDPIGDLALKEADSACVWGGASAVEYVKRHVREGVPVAEFGPKWSAAAIDLTACDPDEAAYRLVEDACFYDQEACFNTQRVYVRGDMTEFVDRLAVHLERFSARFPLGGANRDALAHRSATTLEAGYLGLATRSGHDWAIIVADGDEPSAHPLTRTLILHPVRQWEEVTQLLDARSQTMSIFPPELSREYGTQWAAAGADRITDLGWARMPRAGWTHDGVYGMHSMVRLVVVERPREEFGKYYPRPEDYSGWQRKHFAGEQWWATPWFMRGGSPAVQETAGEVSSL
ncbi:acyl-CoA reductase [Sphaerisporangium sp. NPDC049002]|uniref:acyl-CoA reductase n=1 Tax=unclassified Sphaerisporangium TaxID=2630420 RepID=UPI0033FD31AC